MGTGYLQTLQESIATSFGMFYHPGSAVEVRIFLKDARRSSLWAGVGSILSGYFDDLAALSTIIARVEKQVAPEACYITLNPVNVQLLARAHNRLVVGKRGESTPDDQIDRRSWLMIDLDPIRPEGISATPTELAAAQERAELIRDHLSKQGWPRPATCFSGNGYHLLYPVDLPNDAASRDLVKHVLLSLQLRFSEKKIKGDLGSEVEPGAIGVRIDPAVFNAARITKLYGTVARKGDPLGDREHRQSYVVDRPAIGEIVTAEQLQNEAAIYLSYAAMIEAEKAAKARPHQTGVGESPIDRYNAETTIEQALQAHGYRHDRGDRWIRPGGENGTVLVDAQAGRSYHFNSSDVMSNGHRCDPFDFEVTFNFNGDRRAAVKHWASRFGLNRLAPQRQPVSDQPPTNEQPGAPGIDEVASAIERIGHIPSPVERLKQLAAEIAPILTAPGFNSSHYATVIQALVESRVMDIREARAWVKDRREERKVAERATKSPAKEVKRTFNADHPLALDAAADEVKIEDDDQFLLQTPPTDYGNALCVQRLYGTGFAVNESLGLAWFDGKRWQRANAEANLSDAVIKTLRRRGKLGFDHDKGELIRKSIANGNIINGAMARFKLLKDQYVPVELFDAKPYLLNCRNGVVDLRTGEITPHKAEHLITQYIDYDYKPDAPQGAWLAYLATIIGDYHDPAVADYIKMLSGYSVTGETRDQIMIYLLGEKGRNGKGTFVDIIQTLLGDYATGSDFTTLTRKRDQGDQGFDIAKLRGARWVITSESDKEARLNEAKVKEITGQDTITASHKGKDPFSFKPTFKVWALSNHPPKGDTTDDSFWDRVKIVNFPHSFLGREDTGLRDRLTEREVLEGVLAWLVEGAIMWYGLNNKRIRTPEQLVAQTAATRDQQDSVRTWIKEDCVIGDSVGFTPTSALYQSYKAWCDSELRDDAINIIAFSKRLTKAHYPTQKRRVGGAESRGFAGIRPKTAIEREDGWLNGG